MSFVSDIDKALRDNADRGIAIYRIAVGFMFATHGAATLFGVFGGAKDNPGGATEFLSWPSWWAGAIQLIGGTLIALGVGTRVAAFISSGSMAYAYFVVHQSNGLLPIENDGTPAALYAWALVILVFTGPGAWALDKVLPEKKPAQVAEA